MNLLLKKNWPIREASSLELKRLFDAVETDKALRFRKFRDRLAQNAQAFNLNPPITPVPASGAWIYSFGGNAANTLNATSTNSSSTLTINWPSTTALAVGQPISGLNILPNTTISVVGATTVTLSQNTASSGAATGAVTVINNSPLQSSAFGGNTFYGIPSAAALAADVPGCMFYIPEAQTLLVSSTNSIFYPAPGEGYLALTNGATTGSTIRLNVNSVQTTLYTATVSVTTTFYITADGGNLNIQALGATSPSFVYYRFRAKPQV